MSSFSTSYIGEVFDAFALGPHNMLAVKIIKSSMDQWIEMEIGIRLFANSASGVYFFELAGEMVCTCIMTSVEL